MTSSVKTILILGGTSGIGEAFARRLHAQGKRVIISGRRQARLDALAAELPGLETHAMDVLEFGRLAEHAAALFTKFPDIDTVWVNAGIQGHHALRDPQPSSDAAVQAEIDTNVTAPTLLAQHFASKLAAKPGETSFWITSSGLGFVPNPLFPVYCSTKAYVHSLCVALREPLAKDGVSVVEIVPPLVDAGVGAGFASYAMTLDDYLDETFKQLDSTPAKDLKEVAAGSAVMRVKGWRDGLGPVMQKMNISG